ncbi:NAD(P)/FAD-dependent oxidoreductase [Streptomyces sporangiiformans]|uniref:FAD-dependent oxidoreductase n=1 Tax=Streptomyces sporangiiformans TaxID=2315329 RepID=A0A505D412_9ACTN|nr:NAD(P)/FAD-dependent oxidoreductase [Streptomyces sporangiiformans]TPQ17340.1 FAD-dependent oxidoreductase [Streptomyces sporangiiformans]
MLEPAYQADVVIVGAGVAGLSAAHRLTSAGVTTVVLEGAPCVGGRMATEKVDGFRLDRIGQLLSTSYPELRLTPGLDALALRPFAPGVLVHADGRTHRAGELASAGGARGALGAARAFVTAPRRPRGARRTGQSPGGGAVWPAQSAFPPLATPPLSRAFPPLGGAVDQARLAAVLGRIAAAPVDRLLARPEQPAGRAVAARGVPARTVEGFLRPLLAALLCDPDLTTSSRCADLALRAFASGRLCLPEGGADTLPELLAGALPPGTVHTGVHVTSVSTTSVSTAEHGEIRCGAVLLATGAREAAELLPGLRVPSFHPVTVVHHTADETPSTGAALLLDADRRGPVAHTAVISQVDPSRAPAGRALISSTILGAPPPDADRVVRAHLADLYGTSTLRWELLAVHHTPEAVPAMPPPHDLRRPVRLLAGLYICGDHRDTSTVQGALHSGHRAAAALLADLGITPAHAAARLPRAA